MKTDDANTELDRVFGGEDGVSPIRFAAERSAGAAPLDQLLELAERYHSGHSVAGSPCTCDLCRELRVVRRYARLSEGTE